jgi:dihydropteroate synthase
MHWQTSRFKLDLSRPLVMGIVNLTPDSFSDGGRAASASQALARCEQLLADGAHILDLGAESTRPGAQPVPLDEELARLMPVLTEAVKLGVPLSIDTYKPEVMRAALDAGADIVNDIWALRHPPVLADSPAAVEVVAAHPSCGVCLMHMHRDPQTMQLQPMAGDVVDEVLHFLEQRVSALKALGVDLNRISVDPGIGFGKTPPQNLSLLAHQQRLSALGCPVLAGWSRKSTLGSVLGDGGAQATGPTVAEGRRVASVTAALLAVQQGACVVRVHDVKETVQALAVWSAVRGVQRESKT